MKWSRRAAILVAALLAGSGLAGSGLAGCGRAAAPAPRSQTRPSQAIPSPTRPPSDPTSRVAAAPHPAGPPTALPVAPGAGAEPQTRNVPSTDSVAFRHAMTDLWLAVTTGNSRLGLPAFFPLPAYKQVKAIYDPAEDWHERLWYDFTLDVGAAHGLVGRGARLVRVVVPVYDEVWVYPGECDNVLGYWHVPGARVVYEQHGQERSFGIASLISWRGVWYVVHFGAVLRDVVTGIVDQPAAGPGIPGPPGGC
ncbi:MAG: hypothetical protein ABSA53_18925 [Streptosporangiaceae bacterium]